MKMDIEGAEHAALQGAILLIAAKRMDAISAAMAENDYRTNVEAKKEVEDRLREYREQIDDEEGPKL